MQTLSSLIRTLSPRTLTAIVAGILLAVTLTISMTAVAANAGSQRDRIAVEGQQTSQQILEEVLHGEDHQAAGRQISSILGL